MPADFDAGERERMALLHLPYARILAATAYAQRLHDEIPFDEYLQFASVGLLEALDRFDPQRGVQFRTFASKRIQGAILNGLERLTEKNQQIALRKRLHQERLRALREEAERSEEAGDAGRTTAAGNNPQEALFRRLAEIGIGLALGMLLEDTGMVASPSPDASAPGVSPEVSYFRQAELRQLREALRDLVQRLPDQERSVIRQHYLQEMPFDTIATRMGVSRARISQLHRKGLRLLRELSQHNPRYEAFW